MRHSCDMPIANNQLGAQRCGEKKELIPVRSIGYLAIIAALSAVPASAQVIEPTCGDFLYARAAGLSMAGYDARIMVDLMRVNQAALGNARTVAKEAANFCQGNPGYLYDDVIKQIIAGHVAGSN